MSLTVSSFGMHGNQSSLAARVQATLDFYGFPEDFPVTINPDAVHPLSARRSQFAPMVAPSDLEGLVGNVQLEFVSNVSPWATCKVTLPAHTVQAWADDFQRGNQWELMTVKQVEV